MTPFEFRTPPRIVFGRGRVAVLAEAALAYGRRALFVCGADRDRTLPVRELLTGVGLELVVCSIQHEPHVEDVERAVQVAREARAEVVLAVGGGSALDAAKAIAALATADGPPLDYLEVIGAAKKLERAGLPFLAAATTSGTGAEVTKNAVLNSTEHRVKVSLRDERMLPKLAVVDPELTLSVPPAVTAATGLDALTQVLEPYVSNQSNPMTDVLALEGLRRAARSLLRAYRDGADIEAREDLCVTSLFGGLALANAKLGAVHGFAGPFGGMFEAPHGAVCARFLPYVMEANVRALSERVPGGAVVQRYDHVAQVLTGNPRAKARDGIEWVQSLAEELGVPRLGAYGLTRDAIPILVEKSARSSSMKGNPIALTTDELTAIAERAL